jgi:uncharacterized RDD family membrane protein YckC
MFTCGQCTDGEQAFDINDDVTAPGMITPEAVVVDLPVAGLGSRGLARVFDLFLQFMAIVFGSAVVGAARTGKGGLSSSVLVVALLVLAFVSIFLYPILFEALWHGRTPGKAVLGIRVVTTEGSPISARHAVIRGVVGLIDLPTGVGIVSMLCTRRQQRLGDLAAGTVVLRERSVTSPGSVPISFVPPPGCEGFARSLDLSRVSEEELELIRSFLVRVNGLDAGHRWDLSVTLATSIAKRQSFPIPDWASPELVLVCAVALWQLRSGYYAPVGAPAGLAPAPVVAPVPVVAPAVAPVPAVAPAPSGSTPPAQSSEPADPPSDGGFSRLS